MAEIPPDVIAAIKSGDFLACYAKCWPCQFGQCTDEPHTWMDDEDIEATKDLERPTTAEGWAALAATRPCGCHCMKRHRDEVTQQSTLATGSRPPAVDRG